MHYSRCIKWATTKNEPIIRDTEGGEGLRFCWCYCSPISLFFFLRGYPPGGVNRTMTTQWPTARPDPLKRLVLLMNMYVVPMLIIDRTTPGKASTRWLVGPLGMLDHPISIVNPCKSRPPNVSEHWTVSPIPAGVIRVSLFKLTGPQPASFIGYDRNITCSPTPPKP